MLRRIFAVATGFILWTILWLGANAALGSLMPGAVGVDGSVESGGYLGVLLVLSVLFSIAAGWLTAMLAPGAGTQDALVLGLVLLAVGIFFQIQSWALLPLWFHLAFLALLVPGAVFGGRLWARRQGPTG